MAKIFYGSPWLLLTSLCALNFGVSGNVMAQDVIQPSEIAGATSPNLGQNDGPVAVDDTLLGQSLEELLSQEVTSASKKSRPVGETAGAVTVITQEQIRRSSARTVPDLLRMVPGMEVAEVQSSATSVSARGFTSRFAANLLVMIDGAAIYTTSISGMFWDQALIPLQDIERIEVIRGPGGTVWGSNATNGVINIITKQSVDTQGLRANASVGSNEIRAEWGYGAQASEELALRAYGDYRRTKGLDGLNGPRSGDGWEGGLVGIRFDFASNTTDNIVGLAEITEGRFSERTKIAVFDPLYPRVDLQTENNGFHTRHVLARWNHVRDENFDFTLQAYYNNLSRTEFKASINRDLYDLSFESRLKASSIHEFNFGVGGRISVDHVVSSPALVFTAGKNVDRWLTGFIQDEVTVIPNKLRLTLGSKFEQNNFTGFEHQPGARLFYRHNSTFSGWASVARAVRTPLLAQREMFANVEREAGVDFLPQGFPMVLRFEGSRAVKTENLLAIELGARAALGDGWTLDFAAYRSRYTSLVTGRSKSFNLVYAPAPFYYPIGVIAEAAITNEGSAISKGFEILTTGPITPNWTVDLSYSYIDLKTWAPLNRIVLSDDQPTPRHQVRASSRLQVTNKVQLDAFAHWVSASKDGKRRAYLDTDLRANWRLNAKLELSVVGNNLLHARRMEYYQDSLPLELVAVPRSVYVEARVRF